MEGTKAKIVFSLEQDKPEDPSVLEEEREKHRQRAERFKTDYVKPEKKPELRLEARKERLKKPGFATGLDVFAPEEVEKRRQRAERFNLPETSTKLEYAPDQSEAARKRRAEKFGLTYQPGDAQLMELDLLESRQEAAADAVRREDAVYLYGVDVMSTSDVMAYFGDYCPTFVEWINDSSCVVLFEDSFTAKRAVVGTGSPLPAADAPDSCGGQDTLDPSDPASIPFLWHKGRDFVKQGTSIPLMYRIATEADRRDPNAPRNTRGLWRQQQHGGGKARRLNGRQQQRQQQQYGEQGDWEGEYGADGDVEMRQARGERGGQRQRRRKVRQQGHAGAVQEVEMEDAEWDGQEPQGQAGAAAAAAAAAAAGVPDLRQLLGQKQDPMRGHFSAAAALGYDADALDYEG